MAVEAPQFEANSQAMGAPLFGELLITPVDLSNAIDVTPHVLGTPSGDLSADMARGRKIPFWRKAAIAGTAFVAGLSATGATPKPVDANGFLVTGSSANTTAECIDDTILVYKTPPVIAVIARAENGGQPVVTDTAVAAAELPQDVEIALGNGVVLVNAPACEIPNALPTANEAIDLLLSPKIGTIKKVKPITIKKLIDNLWAGNPELDSFIDPYTPTADFSKQYMLDAINYLFDKGFEFRADVAAGWIAVLFSIYDREEKFAKDGTLDKNVSTQARSEIRELTGAIFNYTVTELTVRDQEAMIKTIASKARTFYEYDILHQIQVLP